jgi:hypothetical protein
MSITDTTTLKERKLALALCMNKITGLMAMGIANQVKGMELLTIAFECCGLKMSEELQASRDAVERGEQITLSSFQSFDDLLAP